VLARYSALPGGRTYYRYSADCVYLSLVSSLLFHCCTSTGCGVQNDQTLKICDSLAPARLCSFIIVARYHGIVWYCRPTIMCYFILSIIRCCSQWRPLAADGLVYSCLHCQHN